MSQIQNLIANPAFELLREQAQTNPSIIPQLLKMLEENYPTLYQLFSTNPSLLLALLSGNAEGSNMYESEADHSQHIGGEAFQAVDLTEEDQKSIKEVF